MWSAMACLREILGIVPSSKQQAMNLALVVG